jgi:hypothetical protein
MLQFARPVLIGAVCVYGYRWIFAAVFESHRVNVADNELAIGDLFIVAHWRVG